MNKQVRGPELADLCSEIILEKRSLCSREIFRRASPHQPAMVAEPLSMPLIYLT